MSKADGGVIIETVDGSALEALALVGIHGSITNAANAVGINRSTLRDRYYRAKREYENAEHGLRMEHVSSDKSVITSFGSQVRTIEEALAKAEVDPDIWEVEKSVVNSWPTVTKNAAKKPEQVMNWQVKVFLRRKAPKHVQDGIRGLLEDFAKKRPKRARRKYATPKSPHLLELCLYDAHFGKLCWGEETGTKYDLDIAEKVFTDAIVDLLDKSSAYSFERIILPIGNDFFQANNWQSTTAKGTHVDSVDDRMQRVFRVGARAITETINLCKQVAPVEVLWVPGNHDLETSWYLVEWLRGYFTNDENVSFDTSPAPRKYIHYGCSLIGFTHGNEEKHSDLPLLMAQEHPEWSECICKEFHIGHYHKKKEMRFVGADEFGGIRIRVLPSLSGTDSWHFKKGYVKNRRAAEAHIWSPNEGWVGSVATNVL